MTLGDGFATPFTKGSYFELKIFGFSGLNGTGTEVGEVDFYLANYTSASSLPVDVWTLVNLSSLAGRKALPSTTPRPTWVNSASTRRNTSRWMT